jgi:hypothetical protein
MRQDIAAIEEECRLEHTVVDLLEIKRFEFIPFRENGNAMGTVTGLQCTLHHDEILVLLLTEHISTDLLLGNLRIIDINLCPSG